MNDSPETNRHWNDSPEPKGPWNVIALKLVYEIIHEDNDNPVGDIDLREFIAVLRLDFCDPDIQISGLSLFRNGRIDKNRQLSFSCGLLVAFENFTLY